MNRQRKSSRRPIKPTRRRARLESLESRRLLTVVVFDPLAPISNTEFTVRRDEPSPVELRLGYSSYGSDRQDQPIAVIDSGEGTASIPEGKAGTVLYQPEPGFVGVDVITVSMTDFNSDATGDNTASEYRIAINVVEPLIALDDWYSVSADTSTELSLDVLSNDTTNANYLGSNPQLTIQSISGAETIDVSIAGDGKHLVYTPAAGFTGVHSFQYTTVDEDGYTATGTAQVRVFDGEASEQLWPEQLQQQLVQQAVQRHQYSFGTGVSRDNFYDVYRRDAFALDTLGVPASGVGDAPDTSGTNNQIADVDESDRIKTDGDYLYVLTTPEQTGWMGWNIFPWVEWGRPAITGLPDEITPPGENMLTVIDIQSPENPTIVAREIFADKVLSLDLHGDRLSVIAEREGQTVVSTLDVSDPQNVDTVSTTVASGQFKQARRVSDSLYVFTDQYGGSVPDLETIATSDNVFSFRETAQQYLERVQDSLVEIAMPSQQVLDGEGSPVGDPILAVDPLQFGVDNGHWINVLAFDTQSDVGGAFDWDINKEGSTFLVTPHSIYITHTDYQHHWIDADITDVIDFVPELPSISTVIDRYELQADGSVELVAQGSVPGTLKNSFSLDEYDGHLRIATENAWRFGPAEGFGSSVYVLQQSENELDIVGAATGLAPGESIYAVRFAGERGYVVTFRRVDPLFVLDLSEPTDPQVKGELKVPGYSQYLHVLSDTHILGVGRDADPDTGLYQGLTVSLFDVTEAENPLLQDRYLFAGGRSTFSPFAEGDPFSINDHHAISYFGNEDILALPYYSQTIFGGNFDGVNPNAPIFESPGQSAVATFRIDELTGISTLDNIPFDSRADRAMRVGDYLYSLSQNELKVTHLTEPNGVIASLEFERQGADDFFETNVGEEVTVDVTGNDGVNIDSTIEILAAALVEGDGEVVVIDNQHLQFKPGDGRLSPYRIEYTARNQAGTLINAIATIDPDLVWQNTQNRFDINNDGKLTPRDILNVINTISDFGATDTESIESAIENSIREFHFFSDTNGDKQITPDDILQVINRIAASAQRNSSQATEFELGQPFDVALNQFAENPDSPLKVSVVNVIEDSRCPTDAECVWEGQVRAELETQISGDTSVHTLSFQSGQDNAIEVAGYSIKLHSVSPDTVSDDSIEDDEYRFTLSITLLSN
ncbi:beta-propeller domain-containing protein [Planctomycetes bacterium K23_9]|uniref:Beta propeller domain protein n=1 Tax=Stieleria marina TaxID=1930275 RepID=A0A517NLX1_9BACT|nr:Beta propeller domain protein [Planctomycetes bacterium K23_9]